MTRRNLALGVVGGINATVLALAFVFAPTSCEGGFGMYFLSGVGALAMLLALPFLMHLGSTVLGSMGWALGLLLLGVGVWLTGLLTANFRILCRLF